MPRKGGDDPVYQRFVKIWLGEQQSRRRPGEGLV